jgi:hypothetical protein
MPDKKYIFYIVPLFALWESAITLYLAAFQLFALLLRKKKSPLDRYFSDKSCLPTWHIV